MLIELLKIHRFLGVSKTIDIAKGANKIPENVNEGIDQIKREWHAKKY
jgi:hypothetical protein